MSAHPLQLSADAKAILPTHVAIIMDGNGRWAKQRFLPRVEGHRQGVESVRAVVRAAGEVGVKYLTLYAFSVENWNRPKAEVDTLMNYLERFLRTEIAELQRNHVRLEVIGQIYRLPEFVQKQLARTRAALAKNKGLTLILALSYGGRTEIIETTRDIAAKVKKGDLEPEEITEQVFSQHLYTHNWPDPDLLIRTSGEMRISNFLLWQISYAELVVTPTLWPDFRRQHFIQALEEYTRRHRRFGELLHLPNSALDTPVAGSLSFCCMPNDRQPPTPSRSAVFLRRLLSFAILWTVVLTALFSRQKWVADYLFLFIMMTLAGMGLEEFYGLVEKRDLVCFKYWGVLGGLLLMAATFFHLSGELGTTPSPARANDFETSFLILFVLGLCLRQFASRTNTAGILAIATTLFGLMYVPWLLNFVQKINFFPGVNGKYYLLYFVVVTKFSDIGAYCVGSLIGRHKMIPRISPGKTWEGFIGAVVVSTAASLLFAGLAGDRLAGMNRQHALALGILLSTAAVVGDLIESLFKREAGVKDSGRWFPGIGGILDLLDSLLFNAPLMYLYLRHVLT